MNNARSMELFLIDGRPDGMLTAGVFNWTGHVLRIPRTQLKDGLNREEAKFTGVYVLLGDNNGSPLAYVGEAEDMSDRLRDHASKKDWWDTAILITTSANNLHKAHVRYLEARLIAIAKDVGAMPLENGNQPSGSSLSEADRANMESFLGTLGMVLPAIRVDNFLLKKRHDAAELTLKDKDHQVVFECRVLKHDIHAFAVLSEGEMIVRKGSKVRGSQKDDVDSGLFHSRTRRELIESGKINQNVLTIDYAFQSPSGSASVVTGRPTNGRTAWRVVETGQTYAEWENAQLSEADQ